MAIEIAESLFLWLRKGEFPDLLIDDHRGFLLLEVLGIVILHLGNPPINQLLFQGFSLFLILLHMIGDYASGKPHKTNALWDYPVGFHQTLIQASFSNFLFPL